MAARFFGDEGEGEGPAGTEEAQTAPVDSGTSEAGEVEGVAGKAEGDHGKADQCEAEWVAMQAPELRESVLQGGE